MLRFIYPLVNDLKLVLHHITFHFVEFGVDQLFQLIPGNPCFQDVFGFLSEPTKENLAYFVYLILILVKLLLE